MFEPYPNPHSTHRKRITLMVVTGVIVAVLVAVVLLVSRGGDEPGAAAPVPFPALGWSEVASVLVPSSPGTGPMRIGSGTASGFSHDAGGAVVAALNISARIEAAAPRAARETTLREQCFGNVDPATLTGSSSESSTSRAVSDAPVGSTRALAYYYRVEGDPDADLVVVDVAAETGQSRATGSYAHFRRTLRWVGGDWQMQVPVERAQALSSLQGYALLGRP